MPIGPSSGGTVTRVVTRHMPVPAGWLRIRVAKSNLEVAARLDVDSDEAPETMERIRIQAWPSAPEATVVLKRWQPQQA